MRQLNRWDVLRFALQAIAAAVALYYFLAYSSGCSFTRGPLRGRDELADVAGDASEGRGSSSSGDDGDAVAELEQLDAAATDAGELEQLDAAAADAGELEQLDAAADAGAIDAGGAKCVATCQGMGYPTAELCMPSELPGQTRCCCAAKP